MFTRTVYTGSEDGSVRRRTFVEERKLSGDQVLVQITAAGLCATDARYRFLDMVLGHEAVGFVEEIGPEVQFLGVGDRVGWGYQHGSCGRCIHCLSGDEVHCMDGLFYGLSKFEQGAFATHAIWNEPFLLSVPKNLADIEAAPLMCAGGTVFSALKNAGIRPGGKVGILGLGGLGHLAVQFAAKQGYRVTVISRTQEKRNDALGLGATEFYTMDDVQDSSDLDALFVTADRFDGDWTTVIRSLARKGKICVLGFLDGDFKIPAVPLVTRALQIQGSLLAPRHCSAEMLSFAAHSAVRPLVQTFPLTAEGITTAMRSLEAGEVRYRAVFIPEFPRKFNSSQ